MLFLLVLCLMSVYTVIVQGLWFYMCLSQWDCGLNYLKDTIIINAVNNNFLPSILPDAHHPLPTPDNILSHLFVFLIPKPASVSFSI